MEINEAKRLVSYLFGAYPSIYVDEAVASVWVREFQRHPLPAVSRALDRMVDHEVTNRVCLPVFRQYLKPELIKEQQREGLQRPALADGEEPATKADLDEMRRRVEEIVGRAAQTMTVVSNHWTAARAPEEQAAAAATDHDAIRARREAMAVPVPPDPEEPSSPPPGWEVRSGEWGTQPREYPTEVDATAAEDPDADDPDGDTLRCGYIYPSSGRGGPQCIRSWEHDGPHTFKCAGPSCPGLSWPASERPHPPTCNPSRSTCNETGEHATEAEEQASDTPLDHYVTGKADLLEVPTLAEILDRHAEASLSDPGTTWRVAVADGVWRVNRRMENGGIQAVNAAEQTSETA